MPTPKTKPKKLPTPAKLRERAEALQSKIVYLQRPMTAAFTQKRGREYDQRIAEGHRLKELQDFLNAAADAIEKGTLPPELDMGQKNDDLVILISRKRDNVGGGRYVETHEFNRDTPDAKAAQHLMLAWQTRDPAAIAAKEAAEKKQQIENKMRELRNTRIPGFFPTPEPLAKKLIEYACGAMGGRRPASILEPSAGLGALAHAAHEEFPESMITCIEINLRCAEILSLQGFNVAAADFLEDFRGKYERLEQFDLVVMNPPFENMDDCTHVMVAWDSVAPGGVLAAIVSNMAGVSPRGQSGRFKLWMDRVEADVFEVEDGAFDGADAFNRTGVKVKIVVARKES